MKQEHTGAIILGLHDAIVSLTGLIAGLFSAAVETDIIILSCIISSVTASLSMGVANYLAVKSMNQYDALRSGLDTCFAYLTTCVMLILPFFVFSNRVTALIFVGLMAILVILGFNALFYRGKSFYRHFFEMLIICAIVSTVAFLIGEFANKAFGI